ncbi:GNAT family N-acetyltransferase [Planomonospora parontospora]|uniref:GNAT family N-acetyltransferase n=1 Tax=Planomonospora parontospora TaxID=58119 RepID=UPI001784A0B2|nr:GNAT family N-acetyltransferase [Planomonospora parontospora]
MLLLVIRLLIGERTGERVRAEITLSSPVQRSARVLQLQGMFDVPIEEKLTSSWAIDVPVEDKPWSVGLVVGPSGAGKSTLARHLWPGRVAGEQAWTDRALVDDFPRGMSIKDIVALLGAVGLSSPPAWLRPYATLSNGEAFRASMARALAEAEGLVVVDEFTSVVDRQVASHAVAKTVRRRGRQFVAVTCHYDVLDWLQPDWVLDVAASEFRWRQVQPRPQLQLEVRPVDRAVWPLFARHHYLTGSLHRAAKCFGGFINGELVAFTSYRHFPHPKTKTIKMAHRTVVLPDYQGLSIGGKLTEWVGQHLYGQGYRLRAVMSHPALIAYRSRSPRWRMVGQDKTLGTTSSWKHMHADTLNPRRLGTVSFEYVPRRPDR